LLTLGKASKNTNCEELSYRRSNVENSHYEISTKPRSVEERIAELDALIEQMRKVRRMLAGKTPLVLIKGGKDDVE
jgi:hypothetical protein